MTEFIRAEHLDIGDAFGNESFVQSLLADDPSLLNLGDLVLRGKERVQTSSGRLDLLFESADGGTWYEVEVQLGATNETHIIRTLEYWDIERRHRPNIRHIAVIVAEQITQRFFNVIALFNGHIPIVAIQMNAFRVGNEKTIHFTKVLDHSVISPAIGDEDVYEASDRAYWVKKTSERSIQITDEILQFAQRHSPSSSIKYNKGYIAIKNFAPDGRSNNFISMRPGKKEFRFSVRSPQNASLDAQFDIPGVKAQYDEEAQRYIFDFAESSYPAARDAIRKTIDFAYKALGVETIVNGVQD